MHGQITKFHSTLGYGIIETDDGAKFRFARASVKNPNGKLIGYDVDFLVSQRKATDIILMHGTPWTVFATSPNA